MHVLEFAILISSLATFEINFFSQKISEKVITRYDLLILNISIIGS